MARIDFRQLHYFVAVAEELNFTRAAQRCHVVQSALSYQIAKLERDTGVALFERTSRAVRLAPAGRTLLPRARHILAELDLAGAELTALAGVLTGKLRLGMIGSASVAAPSVEHALAMFHRRHAGVEITVEDTGSANMADRIRDGELDLAELAGEEFVELRPESGLRRQVDAAFDRAGVSRSIAFELSTSDNVVRFVQLGFGVALVPRSSVRGRDVPARRLSDDRARHPVSLVHRSPAPSAPAAQAFLALLDRPRPTVGPGS